MRHLQIGIQLSAALIAITLVLSLNYFILPAQYAVKYGVYAAFDYFWKGSAFFILNLLAVIGLHFHKRWGFFCAYAAIIFSTINFSLSYIPYITPYLPAHARFMFILSINIGVMGLIGYLHMWAKRLPKPI